jgi:hypothetical protein
VRGDVALQRATCPLDEFSGGLEATLDVLGLVLPLLYDLAQLLLERLQLLKQARSATGDHASLSKSRTPPSRTGIGSFRPVWRFVRRCCRTLLHGMVG